MMKPSYYNNYIDYENYSIYYNSYHNTYLLINNDLNSLFKNNIDNIDILEIKNKNFYKELVNGGLIVDNEIDEKAIVLYKKNKAKFASSEYNVMINPTLDCNLKCWYCFETHKPNSTISTEIMDSIMKNIEKKYAVEPFSELSLSFFGGEPLLKTKVAVIPFIKKADSFVKQKNIKLSIGITTNGTIISDTFLTFLKPFNVSFQITFDGGEELHNSIRSYKNGSQNSFTKIVKNLHKIQNTLENFSLTLRINYNNDTLKNIDEIVDNLTFLDHRKASYHFNRIWQVNKEDINNEYLIYATNYILEKKFVANVCTLGEYGSTCYADNYNQLLVNYDGQVFKCSSRDFTKENRDGMLQKDGTVDWDMNKFVKRMGLYVRDVCKECKLLPSCPNFCSQSLIETENVNNTNCYIDNYNPFEYNDYIAYNFKRHLLVEELDNMEVL